MLSMLFDIYVVSPAHRAKKSKVRREDEAMLSRVISFLGPDSEVRAISDSDIEGYKQARKRGECGPGGRPVRARAVAKDLVSLRTMLSWATRQRDSRRQFLLDYNPLRGVKLPVEKNPRRPVETYDRYLRLMEVVGDIDWRLPCAVALAESTGQRIGSILRVRREDLELDRLPHGWVLFGADRQKTGRENSVAIPPYVREVLLHHLAGLPEQSDGWLFPSERDMSKPVDVSVMSRYLRRAYELAGLELQRGSLWHAWRRKWATERKEMPLGDVAAAGGWKDHNTLLKSYQRPDQGTLVRVFLDAPKLYGEEGSTPNATPGRTEIAAGNRRIAR
jgi:integrase